MVFGDRTADCLPGRRSTGCRAGTGECRTAELREGFIPQKPSTVARVLSNVEEGERLKVSEVFDHWRLEVHPRIRGEDIEGVCA